MMVTTEMVTRANPEEKASETPYITASKAELYVNTAAADKIGMKLDASYVKDAAQTFDEITVK